MTDRLTFREALEDLQPIRAAFAEAGWSGVGQEAWSLFFVAAARLCSVTEVFFVSIESQDTRRIKAKDLGSEARWSTVVGAPDFAVFLSRANQQGFAVKQPNPHSEVKDLLLAVRCFTAVDSCLIFVLEPVEHARVQECLARAQLVSDCVREPAVPNNAIPPLDLLADVYRSERFQTAAYRLVNGIAGQLEGIDQVILGWRRGAYIRVRAISHYERFERKTDTVKLFEAALEEAADQSVAIEFDSATVPQGHSPIVLAHHQLRVHLSAEGLFTFPMANQDDENVLVLMLVGYRKKPSSESLESVHFLMQTLFPRLESLAVSSAPFLTRIEKYGKRLIQKFTSRDNALIKYTAVALGGLLLSSMLFTTTYTVEGAGQFVTDNTRIITAPFDGVISRVHASSGDTVSEGDLLLELDSQELTFQLSELQAELQRYIAEANKARAGFKSVELEIASARADQVRARVERVRLMITQARLTAPLQGVVVEGERHQLISAPVTKGQALLRVAQTQGLYLSLLVADEDIQHLREGQTGEFSLVSQPQNRFPLRVKTVVPMATVEPGMGARFRVLAEIEEPAETWWRPGMTGVAKIEAGERTWFWIVTHRLVNRLRLFFW
jgi:multidrug resistance efflux pump